MSPPLVEHRLVVPHPQANAVLVETAAGRPRLPRVTTADRHTAEVDHINAAVRDRFDLVTTVLRGLRHDLDPRTGTVTRAHVLEVHGGSRASPGAARWLALDRIALAADDALLVSQWRATTREATVDGREWTRPGWFAEAREWIARALDAARIGSPTQIVQLRAWPSSCLLLVRATGGDFYHKAVAESGRRECAVAAYLARHCGAAVPALVSQDRDRRWLLMRGCPGPKLEDVGDARAWERAAAVYARLQVGCIEHTDALRAIGCPERSLETLDAAIEPLASDPLALRLGEPDGLSAVEVEQLRASVPELRRRCAALRAMALPLTLEHGDLWPGNFLVDGEQCVLIDWEDVAIGHPFFSLAPLLVGLATYQPALDSPALRQRLSDGYLEPFAALATAEDLRAALELAAPLSFVDMAVRYRQQPPSVVRLHPWMRDLVPQALRLALRALLNTST